MNLKALLAAGLLIIAAPINAQYSINMRNVDSPVNMFVQKEAEYFSNRVSWTDRSGTYYYATKDLKPLKAFRRRMGN